MAGEGYKVNGLRNWYHFNNRRLKKYDSIILIKIIEMTRGGKMDKKFEIRVTSAMDGP